ncbi:hypothetical protein L1987_54936 [Smallanthus sonchifolius]|uniref:Uncharacterized protein n=1 Tax=Smallanthus sonchifolius TaxID=185202 RepID=A0ACB9E9L0_9ASTR|nr:hypothetical protein L1987_54936 [Smallanthus sonchifolius]
MGRFAFSREKKCSSTIVQVVRLPFYLPVEFIVAVGLFSVRPIAIVGPVLGSIYRAFPGLGSVLFKALAHSFIEGGDASVLIPSNSLFPVMDSTSSTALVLACPVWSLA